MIEIVPVTALDDRAIHALSILGNDPHVHRTSSVPEPCAKPYFDDLAAAMRMSPASAIHWAVLNGGAPAGMVSLKKLDYVNASGELSFWIGAAFQGRGMTTAAAVLAIDTGFQEMGLRRIDAHALAKANPGSMRVLSKLGFQKAARADLPAEGRFVVTEGYAWRFLELHRGDWPRIG